MTTQGFRNPAIVESSRFHSGYSRSSAKLQTLIQGCIHDFVRRARSDPKTVVRFYDRIAGMKGRVLEIDVTGGHRLLAQWEDQTLRLLNVGDHDIVGAYSSAKLSTDLQKLEPALDRYWPEGDGRKPFFTANPSLGYSEFEGENDRDWLYYLSDQQHDAVISIFCDQADRDELAPSIILGGPGTGKTVILLNLLKEYCDGDFLPYLVVSEPMRDFLKSWLPELNPSVYGLVQDLPADVDAVLVDDPRDLKDVADLLQRLEWRQSSFLVVAFDPSQLRREVTDEEFREFVEDTGADVHYLNTCYRQKENVGKAARVAMQQIAESTPFADERKIREFHAQHRQLTTMANELRFVNPYGYTQVYETDLLSSLASEIMRIRSHPTWKHWPPLLVVYEDQELLETAAPILGDIHHHRSALDGAESVKGVEYQHVFALLRQDLYNELQHGFSSTGRKTYRKRRLLRIPYSRAKDSFVVFVSP